MSAALFLIANLVAIPSTVLFGILAEKKGPKPTLMIVLIAYCFIGFTAIGLSPLPLESPTKDIDRYDIQLRWDDQNSYYKINTKYNLACPPLPSPPMGLPFHSHDGQCNL